MCVCVCVCVCVSASVSVSAGLQVFPFRNAVCLSTLAAEYGGRTTASRPRGQDDRGQQSMDESHRMPQESSTNDERLIPLRQAEVEPEPGPSTQRGKARTTKNTKGQGIASNDNATNTRGKRHSLSPIKLWKNSGSFPGSSPSCLREYPATPEDWRTGDHPDLPEGPQSPPAVPT